MNKEVEIFCEPPRLLSKRVFWKTFFIQSFGKLCFFIFLGAIFILLFGREIDYDIFTGLYDTNLEVVPCENFVEKDTGFRFYTKKKAVKTLALHFSFRHKGEIYKGVSYCEDADEYNRKVEFPAGKPKYARIQGARRTRHSYFYVGIYILPIIGFWIAFWSFLKGRKYRHLLRNGEYALAELSEKRKRKKYTYSYYNFTVEGKTYKACYKQKLKNDSPEEKISILYDKRNPRKNCIIKEISNRMYTKEQKILSDSSSFIAIFYPFVIFILFTSIIAGIVLTLFFHKQYPLI